MKFVTGRGVNQREIDVVDRVKAVGFPRCRGLIGLRNFSGADWGGKFVGISKKKWVTDSAGQDNKFPLSEIIR